MRPMVNRLQGLAPQPPGGVALGSCVRLGTGPARRGAIVPDVAQPFTGISGPQGDQFQTSDVTGQFTRIFTTTTLCDIFIYVCGILFFWLLKVKNIQSILTQLPLCVWKPL